MLYTKMLLFAPDHGLLPFDLFLLPIRHENKLISPTISLFTGFLLERQALSMK